MCRKCSAAQYITTAQCSTVQYSAVQCSTVQHWCWKGSCSTRGQAFTVAVPAPALHYLAVHQAYSATKHRCWKNIGCSQRGRCVHRPHLCVAPSRCQLFISRHLLHQPTGLSLAQPLLTTAPNTHHNSLAPHPNIIRFLHILTCVFRQAAASCSSLATPFINC
jgi:hypothetical protein